VDNDLALKIYIKARATPKVVAAFAERREFDKILVYSKQVLGYSLKNIDFDAKLLHCCYIMLTFFSACNNYCCVNYISALLETFGPEYFSFLICCYRLGTHLTTSSSCKQFSEQILRFE
jgi:hypothetical protein